MKGKKVCKHGLCSVCKKPLERYQTKFCSQKCRDKRDEDGKLLFPRKPRRGEVHKRPSNGRIKNGKGYVLIREPNHPNQSNAYVLEHRPVMEKHLKRFLEEWELVHHRNGVRDDNRLENLEIVIKKAHFGNVRCPHCQGEFLIR